MTSQRRVLRVGALLQALIAGDVDFLVIGGIAVMVHGYPRATKDLDIVPGADANNLMRLHRVLVDLDAEPLEVGDFHRDEFVPLDADGLASGGNWCLMTKDGRLDVLQYVDGVLDDSGDLAALWERSIQVEVFGQRVRVVGYRDLIVFKERAGRESDLIDIRAMREANGDDGPPA